MEGVLSTLEDECAESQFCAPVAAIENFFFSQAESADVRVGGAYSAVETIVAAEIGYFDESAGVDFVSVKSVTDLRCFGEKSIVGVAEQKVANFVV